MQRGQRSEVRGRAKTETLKAAESRAGVVVTIEPVDMVPGGDLQSCEMWQCW